MIKNKAKVNEVVSDAAMLKRYRNQIKEMERKMKEVPLISIEESNKPRRENTGLRGFRPGLT